MAQTVIGFFEHESDAQKAIQRLEEIGIGRNQVDLSRGSGNMGSTAYSGDRDSTGISRDTDYSTSTSRDTDYSGTSRDTDYSGTSRDTEYSGSGKSDDNAVTRFFKNLFGDDNDEADRYASVGNQGYSIVTVHASSNSDAERAADILDDCGAVDVDETAERFSSGRQSISDQGISGNVSDQGNTYTGSNQRETDQDVTIPKIQEDLQVGKRTVEGGSVRVRSRIVEKPVEESIRLREEHVRVDRQPVNRPVSDADRAAFQEQDIELTERSEVPVVNKEARVVEEVRISKEVTEREETVRDTVRNTEVDVDDNNRRGDISTDDLTTGGINQGNRGNVNRGTTDRSDDDLI